MTLTTKYIICVCWAPFYWALQDTLGIKCKHSQVKTCLQDEAKSWLVTDLVWSLAVPLQCSAFPSALTLFSAPCRVSATPFLLGRELALSKLAWVSTSYFIEPCGFTLWACFKTRISVRDSLILDECPALLAIFRPLSFPPFPSCHSIFERSCFLLRVNGKILKS